MEMTKLLSDTLFSEKMDVQNALLSGLLTASGGSLRPSTFSAVQTIVRGGMARSVFHIGDQLVCSKDGARLVWDVIGIDQDIPADPQFTHSLTLQTHCTVSNLLYDSQEAFWHCDTALPPGTYRVQFGDFPELASAQNKSFQFTLTRTVPAGGLLVGFSWPDVMERPVCSYASWDAETPLEAVSVTQGRSGTLLGTFSTSPQNNLNAVYAATCGLRNWPHSDLRHWLNSADPVGVGWQPKNPFERPPRWYGKIPGFLNGMDPDFLSVLGAVKKVTVDPMILNTTVETQDLVFLLSPAEVWGVSPAPRELPAYPYYANYSDLAVPGSGADKNRAKYSGIAVPWWLRQYREIGEFGCTYVDTEGKIVSSRAPLQDCGVAPVCVIV